MRRILILVVIAIVSASTLTSCPVCDTETGQQVRAEIFNDSFGSTILLISAPFAVFTLLAVALHVGLPFTPWRARTESHREFPSPTDA